MKKLVHVSFAMIVMALLTGCAAMAPVAAPVLSSYGHGTGFVQSQTSVNLSKANFEVLKTNVVGRSKGFSLLGLIPICPARLTTAMDRMYAQSGIKTGSCESIAHLTVEHSSTYWILFSIPQTSVRAQVVRFVRSADKGKTTNSPASTPDKP